MEAVDTGSFGFKKGDKIAFKPIEKAPLVFYDTLVIAYSHGEDDELLVLNVYYKVTKATGWRQKERVLMLRDSQNIDHDFYAFDIVGEMKRPWTDAWRTRFPAARSMKTMYMRHFFQGTTSDDRFLKGPQFPPPGGCDY